MILDSVNHIVLMEAGKTVKIFNEEESKLIVDGTLDVTELFVNKEESTKRLIDALKGRPVYPGHKEREEFREKFRKFREEMNAFRLINKIEHPPEYASWD